MQGKQSSGSALRCLVRLLAGLVILAAALPAALPQEAAARSPARPVVLLSCPAPRDGVCQAMIPAMIQALAEAAGAPTPVIRPVPHGREAPQRPGDLAVALHLETAGADRPDSPESPLSGHLEWRTGAGTPQVGPPYTAAAAALTPQTYASFARALIEATPGMAAALRGQP